MRGPLGKPRRRNLIVPVPDIVSAYGAVEPVAIELKDHRVWMLIRTQQGRFYESFSDDGIHWGAPLATRILSSDSPAGLVRLRDKRLVLLWNNCLRFPYAYGGRHVLHAAISEDDGKSWSGYREVAQDPLRALPPPAGETMALHIPTRLKVPTAGSCSRPDRDQADILSCPSILNGFIVFITETTSQRGWMGGPPLEHAA